MKKFTKIILLTVTLALLGSGLFAWYSLSTNATDNATEQTKSVIPHDTTTVEELLRLVNKERTKAGVDPLIIDERLNQSAQYKADDMFDNDYFSHYTPGTEKKNGLDYLISNSGDLCSYVSENISWANLENTALSSVYGWVHSEEHYKAMINPDYTLTGFGIAGDKIVEHFCIAK